MSKVVGGALGVAGSVLGGISQARAASKVQANLQNQLKENQDWYDRRYNEDATQRADAQAILTKTEESIKQRNQQAAGTQAVMGGTDESVAAAKAANNKALSDATSTIAVNGDKRKDNIENKYLDTKTDLNNQLNELETNKAANTAKAISGVTDAGSSLDDALSPEEDLL